MTQIQGLDAIILIVKDLDKQKDFYKNILGLKVIGDYGDAIFFELGNQKLALFGKDHHPEGTKSLEGAKKGISHLEFSVKEKDLKAIENKLKEAGFHAYMKNFKDADGNLFHFNTK